MLVALDGADRCNSESFFGVRAYRSSCAHHYDGGGALIFLTIAAIRSRMIRVAVRTIRFAKRATSARYRGGSGVNISRR